MNPSLPERARTTHRPPRIARAERRFSLGTLLVGTVFFALLFAVLKRLQVPWPIVIAIIVFLVGVAAAQMLVRDERKARVASMWAGAVLYILAVVAIGVFSKRAGAHLEPWGAQSPVGLVLIGAIAGYIGGVFVAGIFLVSQLVDDALAPVRRRDSPDGAIRVDALMTRQLMIVRAVEEVRAAVRAARSQGLSIGFVPTMGALHEGHLSLIRRARAENGFVVVSVFVNPTQFGPHEDLSHYPRPFDQDVRLCRQEDVELVFAPEAATVYPPGFVSFAEVDGLSGRMEGACRPGHFRGVATVVLKLFNIVDADVAYFGQKDAQQACVIRQLVRDLDVSVEIRVCPTVREPDGLALSSRNAYLSPAQRLSALSLWRCLQTAKELIDLGARDPNTVRQRMRAVLESAPDVVPDYAELVDPATFEPVHQIVRPVLAVVAARVGTTRLIDNLPIEVAQS
jgi:pantoate--beta-alanine ligase